MTELFKFPRTSHLAWLAPTSPRDDKVLTNAEAKVFLSGQIRVEEKVDGANVGISVASDGRVLVQNRGNFLDKSTHAQFSGLWDWIGRRRGKLIEHLGDDRILFGEWCLAVHSVRYDKLADWFLGFDVYDRKEQRFFSAVRRNAFLLTCDVAPVPDIGEGHYDLEMLTTLLKTVPSAFGDVPIEGLYLRQEEEDWLVARAKLVRPEFVQAIETHWTTRQLQKNAVLGLRRQG